MSSIVSPWLILPDGRPAIEWLCSHCSGFVFVVRELDLDGRGLNTRRITCISCNKLDMMSTVWLAPPPPGYAVYRVEWRSLDLLATSEGDASPYPRPVKVLASSQAHAYQQVVAGIVQDLKPLECLIEKVSVD